MDIIDNSNENIQSMNELRQMQDDDSLVPEFELFAAAAQGGRKYMEDRLYIEVGRDTNGKLDFIFAAIYDGHGGVQASDYVCRHLFTNIMKNPTIFSIDDQEVLEAIRSGFLQTHSNMHKISKQWPPTLTGFPCTAGTTATCIFIRKGKLYTGHVGDSSIILANFLEDGMGHDDAKLTNDHKPESKLERQRIEKAGGAVATKSGISRIVWKRPIRGHRGPIRRSTSTENIPFLAVARSLGDFWSHNPDSNQYVVSPEPDVDVFRLKNTDNFIVLTSDGLTNVMVVGVRTIIQILRDVEAKNKQEQNPASSTNQLNYAHSLLQNAFKKWGSLRADNISIICIKLNAEQINQNDPRIMEDNPNMDICKQLSENPYSLIHVNQNKTLRLNTNPVRHIYTGTVDKGVNFQSIRFGRTVNGNEGGLKRKTDQHQHNLQVQECFLGPGFILPEMPNVNGGIATTVDTDGVSCSSTYDGSGVDNYDGGSDAEEIKNTEKNHNNRPVDGSPISMELQRQNIPNDDQHMTISTISNVENGINPEIEISSAKTDQEMGGTIEPPESKSKHVTFRTVGIKRRLQDSDDAYIRHIPNTNTLTSTTTSAGTSSKNLKLKVCLEEQPEDEEEVKPPPAKRSKFQSVFNFFTNLFKW